MRDQDTTLRALAPSLPPSLSPLIFSERLYLPWGIQPLQRCVRHLSRVRNIFILTNGTYKMSSRVDQ